MAAAAPTATTTWTVLDYGQVISRPMDPGAFPAMARAAGLDPQELAAGYWRHRDGYDRGMSAAAYWSLVTDRTLDDEDPLVAELSRLDVAAWSRLATDGLATAERSAAAGSSLALLSNAPDDMADAIDRAPWARPFTHRFFSCRHGMAKPDAAFYRLVLDTLAADPAQVTFYDDREENIRGAAALGINAVHWTTA